MLGGELVGEDVVLPGVAGGETFPECDLALSVQIAVGSIKIVEPVCQEGVHHLFGFFQVHFAVFHGKTHTAEAKILFHGIKISVHYGILQL